MKRLVTKETRMKQRESYRKRAIRNMRERQEGMGCKISSEAEIMKGFGWKDLTTPGRNE